MSHPEPAGQSTTRLGFWIYLMTDCMLFATLFATYAVLRNGTNGGPGAHELFSLPFALIETLILLTSSALSGLMLLAMRWQRQRLSLILLASVLALGAAFLGMELYEFASLIKEGNSWQSSAFLSSFFTLVGTHGLHIAAGLLWGSTLLISIRSRGLRPELVHKAGLFTIFWHFLDVVWIFIFTFVYLAGGIQ